MTDIIIIYQTDEQIAGLTVAPASGHPTDGTDFMCLCRCEEPPVGVTVLGTYAEVFASEELKAIYDRIYPPTYETVGENGETVIIEKPERFGVFA
ncbi:hypothetical protein [Seleniivibrio woodruffii]|uniref:hypothetical protein n=1 Tax=Seleniivibrio woodruffii TaxID=1078050 RepID=UPI00240A5441|nr:hypothetical protein [Seleniivibrio woodruffii]